MSSETARDWLLVVASILVVVELITLVVFVNENSDLKRELRIYQDKFSRAESTASSLNKYLIDAGWKPPTKKTSSQ